MKPSEFFQKNIAAGDFLVTGVKRGETVKGDPYFHMTLIAKGGKERFPAVCWAPLSALIAPVSGTVMEIEGNISTYQGVEQITLTSFCPPEKTPAIEDYVSYDAEKAWDTYLEMLNLIKSPAGDSSQTHYGKYFASIFESVMDDTVLPLFLSGRGGMKVHHCNAGDLVEHSLSVMKQTLHMAQQSEKDTGKPLNLYVLLLAAALHDVGKAYAYDPLTGDILPMEQLVGHISLGNALVTKAMQSLSVPMELQMQISHCILSHHGSKEWGSPVEPKTREAILLHLADMADSRLSQITEQMKESPEGQFMGTNNYGFYSPMGLEKSVPHEVAYPKSVKKNQMK